MSDDLEQIMKHLKRGFARCDRSELELAVTDDFEWHMHWRDVEGGVPGGDPSGKVLVGLDQVMKEIERRRDGWSELRYDDVEERYTADMVVQTFVVSGVDERGRRFNNAAVDLYPIRDGRVARKQTYWKYTDS